MNPELLPPRSIGADDASIPGFGPHPSDCYSTRENILEYLEGYLLMRPGCVQAQELHRLYSQPEPLSEEYLDALSVDEAQGRDLL